MRNDFVKTVDAEVFKLRHQRSTYTMLILAVVVAVIMFAVLEFAARRDWIGVPSGHFIAASVIGWMSSITTLLVVIITSFLISREFALGTIKSTWVRPVSRGGWFAGKLVTAASATTVLYVAAFVVVVGLAVGRLGFTDLMEKDFLVHSAASLTGRLLLTAALTVWSLWAAAALVGALASAINHPGGAIATALGIGIAMTILAAFEPVRPFLLSTYLSLPSEQMVAMSQGVPLPLAWNDLVWRSLAGATAWMVVAFLVGYGIIRKKEITQ